MKNKLYVVGIGPGGPEHITPAASKAIEASDAVVGYRTYVDLIAPLLEGKEVHASGMKQEVARCRQAIELAAGGRTVALVSSGDAGIYGMAGLVLELLGNALVEVEIVPGVSAVQAAAARLGAPLMHDFAVVSLSDLLTPWALIRRRLIAAASADFVVALYNPRSRGRVTQLEEARQILLRSRSPETPVGIVRNACRPGESVVVTDLAGLPEQEVDMFSIVIVGNASTGVDGFGRMVTPRGYAGKYGVQGKRLKDQGKSEDLEPRASSPVPASPRALFVGGTGSDVGKSVLAAGFCRILCRRGLSVAPFKAQNMALNSAVTPEGGEIGRAQALQAAACGIAPHTDMNPVLLKPNSETGSQVVVQGRPVGNMTVAEYHAYKETAWTRVEESYGRLASAHDMVVLEGAGSIAEINLRAHDIVNLRAAEMAEAPVLLVADIDRGGVFAAVVGTLELLSPAERKLVAGVVINKFRGDPSLLTPGIEEVEARTGVPVLGVVPWLDLHLPEEDSLGLARKGKAAGKGQLRIGVVRLPRISNYTDFDPLEHEADVELAYLDDPAGVAGLDLLILPGTKSTLPDLEFLRRSGFAKAIGDYHAAGGRVAGICGGYQMLGRRVADPQGVESSLAGAEGLGLLDVETVLCPAKQTRQAAGAFLPAAGAAGLAGKATGYEIHMGETARGPSSRPLLSLTEGEDGAVSGDGRVWGTYLHGLFDDPALRRALLDALRSRRGLGPGEADQGPAIEEELDRLADHLERHLDLEPLLGKIGRQRVDVA
ncbi:MAG: cobyric acid synthase CobQ [Desulfuromonas sp.]|uniref:cobyric acid synthase n=1 Tax=Desulfuromonas sp. TaxID=892 RepID=UPI000CB3ABFA|nr:cobyric acid synthase [Desulfuromonas sp.]PLX83732.1 MAG: cobyric acid synthase CobQ [Desulfuromonas sp.]